MRKKNNNQENLNKVQKYRLKLIKFIIKENYNKI